MERANKQHRHGLFVDIWTTLIIPRLAPRDLLTLCQTSKWFNAVATNDHLWDPIITTVKAKIQKHSIDDTLFDTINMFPIPTQYAQLMFVGNIKEQCLIRYLRKHISLFKVWMILVLPNGAEMQLIQTLNYTYTNRIDNRTCSFEITKNGSILIVYNGASQNNDIHAWLNEYIHFCDVD